MTGPPGYGQGDQIARLPRNLPGHVTLVYQKGVSSTTRLEGSGRKPVNPWGSRLCLLK